MPKIENLSGTRDKTKSQFICCNTLCIIISNMSNALKAKIKQRTDFAIPPPKPQKEQNLN